MTVQGSISNKFIVNYIKRIFCCSLIPLLELQTVKHSFFKTIKFRSFGYPTPVGITKRVLT